MPQRAPRVLLGLTGGIAAYKSLQLVRLLRGKGMEVRCCLTRAATQFVTPLTLEVLTGEAVYQEEYLTASGAGEELHITAASWADLLCVAPATCHTLAKLAHGLADDFLTTVALAFDGPMVAAPAMHSAMWQHDATQDNVERLRRRGVRLVGPVEGALASGEIGIGRMAEPEEIASAIADALAPGHGAGEDDSWRGVTVLVSAGPTHEPVDPVRFLGNRSSGKMGFALAAEAARRGARVHLVAGPVTLPTPAGVDRSDVVTAREMQQVVHRLAPESDLVILAAAVADYRPAEPAKRKIKKGEGGMETLRLELNPDILAGLAEVAPGAVRVGFAAETEELEAHARDKLERKRVDFLVANDVSRDDIGFGSDHNEVSVFRREGEPIPLSRTDKGSLAKSLLDIFGPALRRRRGEGEA